MIIWENNVVCTNTILNLNFHPVECISDSRIYQNTKSRKGKTRFVKTQHKDE